MKPSCLARLDQIDVIVGVFQRTDFGTVALVANDERQTRALLACETDDSKANKNNPTAIHTIRLSLALPRFRL